MHNALQLRSISGPVIHAALLPAARIGAAKHPSAAWGVLHQVVGLHFSHAVLGMAGNGWAGWLAEVSWAEDG